MSKISQRELLSEGFWDNFTAGGIMNNIGKGKEKLRKKFPNTTKALSWAGSIADTVAPEIMNPIRKGMEWRRNTAEKGQRASMTQDEIAMDYIKEDGFFPLVDTDKIQWNSKKNADGTYTGTIKVGELDFDKNGNPVLGRRFSQDKSTYIVKFDPKDRTAKRVRGPQRHLATSHEDIVEAINNAGHHTHGGIKSFHEDPNTGIITGTIGILIPPNTKPVMKKFSYDTNTGNVTIH